MPIHSLHSPTTSETATPPQNADTDKHDAKAVQNPNEVPENEESEAAQNLDRKLPQKSNTLKVNATGGEGDGLAENKIKRK